MNRLNDYRLELESKRYIQNPVMIKKLGVHPAMKKSA